MDGRTDHELAQVLVEFAHTLGTDFSIQKILDQLVLRIVDILPVTGAGVMVMGNNDELQFVAASNKTVLVIEYLQNELTEGPCLEAYRSGDAVAVTDLRDDSRFPRFSPRALEGGLAAVFTFPMRLDEHRLGALDLYRDLPGALSEADMRAAQILADVAAAYLFNAQARVDASAALRRMSHRSLHDPLTGLPNRALLEELLERAAARASRSHCQTAVLFADLDGFKDVNDGYGHHVGDQLLIAVGKRLTSVLRPGDSVARLGGDEFVLVCEDLHDADEAELVAVRVTDSLSHSFDVAGHFVSLTASVGVAVSDRASDVPQVLLREADFAMYQAKNNGGGHHVVADAATRLAAEQQHDLGQELARAQRRQQLRLAYQPILNAQTNELAAVEALVRWHHPKRGHVPPDVLIPIAERTGLILELGDWILQEAVGQVQRLASSDLSVPLVAVNVSAHQVMGRDFARTVASLLELTRIEPSALCLEVTESVFLADGQRALAVMGEIKDLGVRLSLDDFGTGYSSLSYLRRFPFDMVKIDRSFTADITVDDATRSIVSAIVDLSHVLSMTVVAEGVETPAQITELRNLGADYLQGFYLCHPLDSDHLTAYVAADSAVN